MFQTFNAEGIRFGRRTDSLERAIARVKACKGEVREYGTLTVVYTCKTALPQALRAQPIWWHSTARVQPEPTPDVPVFPLYTPGRAAYPGTSIKVCR